MTGVQTCALPICSDITRRVLKVTVSGDLEPKPWVDAANSQTVTITVNRASWKNWIIPVIFFAFLIIIPVGIYVYRKVSSGEWELRRPASEKDEEEDEEEDEDEPKKKRL